MPEFLFYLVPAVAVGLAVFLSFVLGRRRGRGEFFGQAPAEEAPVYEVIASGETLYRGLSARDAKTLLLRARERHESASLYVNGAFRD